MTYTYLSEEQGARADALDVAHRLLTDKIAGKGLLSAPSTSGLLTDELLPAVRLAEYVLTGKYVATAAERAVLEELHTLDAEPVAGATGSSHDDDGYL